MMYFAQEPGDVPPSWSLARTRFDTGAARPLPAEFPLDPDPVAPVTPPARSPQNLRILVVDDDEWIREVITRVLVRHHYQVNMAPSAEAALGMLRYSSYDLIISDMRMEGMSGLELTAQVARTHPNLPVILITALADTDLMRVALRCGASDYIAKPFSTETIPLIVERNLERHALDRKRLIEHDNTVMLTTVQALAAAIDAKEPFTAEHSRRVACIATHIADSLGLPPSERQFLELAAQVHDVGKIGTPDYILNKPGRLNDEEWSAIRLHPIQGAEIVGRVPQLSYVADVVRHHHEWVNGSGYPDKLCGDEIPLLSRIISVADAYEVMTSTRVYHTPIPDAVARERLQAGVGTQFDVAIVTAFAQIAPECLFP